MPTLVTATLLARLDRALDNAGAPICDAWRPGVSDAEIDEAFSPLGIDVPEELRAWWRWHNGATSSAALLTPHRTPLSMQTTAETAVAEHALWQKHHIELPLEAQLIRFLSEKPFVYAAAGDGRSAPAPIWTMLGGLPWVERLPSMGTLVERWCWLLEQRIWRVAGDRRLWEVDGTRYPHDWYVGVL